jgi:uncharacterized protein (TIGR03067 family)
MKTSGILKVFALTAIGFAVTLGCTRQTTKAPGLEGHWTGVDLVHPDQKCELTITGTNLDFHGIAPDDWCRGTFVLNEQVQPKQMDLMLNEAAPESAGKLNLVIYEIQGNELKIAACRPGSPERPADFTPTREVRVLAFTRK